MLMQIKVGSRVKTNLSACSLGHSSCGLCVDRRTAKRPVNAAGRIDARGRLMPKRTRSTAQQLRFTEPPLRGFLIHLTVFIVVIIGLAALNLIRNPAHPWFLWVLFGWGIAIVVHDLVLLIKSRPKREIPVRPSTPDKA